MENVRMVDEAFLLARINKMSGGGSGDGPNREEFNELVERVNGSFLVAEYGVTPAADIMAYIEAEGDFAPILVKRGNDLYTSLLASKKNDNAVYLRAIGSASGKYYIFDYTVTESTWASKSYGLQELLESGVNIKTINGDSILGAGNIDIQGGGDNVFVAEYGTTTAEEIAEAIAAKKVIVITNDPEFSTPDSPAVYLVGSVCQENIGLPIYEVYALQSSSMLVQYNISPDGWLRFDIPIGGGIDEVVGYEVEIGSYVDADGEEHALFRKIVDLGALPNTGEKSVAHGIEYDFAITSLSGIMRQTNGTAMPLPLVTLDTSKLVYISCGRSNVVVQTASDRSAFTGAVTIEYYYD